MKIGLIVILVKNITMLAIQRYYKGVVFIKKRNEYIAQICVNNKNIRLGYFNNPMQAHEAYQKASIKYHGEFARIS